MSYLFSSQLMAAGFCKNKLNCPKSKELLLADVLPVQLLADLEHSRYQTF
jgi:hypothetical protein